MSTTASTGSTLVGSAGSQPNQVGHDPAFQNALNSFKKELDKKSIRLFSMTTLEGLKQTIVDIQAQQKAGRKEKHMGRLAKFVEAMEQFGKVIQIFCNGNQYVAFVWVSQL